MENNQQVETEKEKLARTKRLRNEFFEFLKEYKVLSLAIAFIMGGASTGLVSSLVNDVIMPIFEPLMAAQWREAILTIGPVHIVYGAFLAQLVNFTILALIVFIVTKKILKTEREEKAK
ncbi:MAG TPA: MscL family protein [Candidatus Paceibacterota bacterium]